MSENNKTILFVFVAVVAAVVAWAARPRLPGVDETLDVINQPLFPEFTNPLAVTSLEIVQFDEQSGEVKPFKVAQVKDKDGKPIGFGIPSHENYPADAKDHLAEAAASLIDLKVLGLATQNPGDFYTYGVVDPLGKDAKPGAVGVGTRITLRDKDDKILLNLIVGKEVPDRKDIRYVRKVDQDPVYEVALKTDKLSANFGDWIEKDLLKISTWDIKGVQIYDYSVDAVQGQLLQRGQIALEYNDSGDPRWKMIEDKVFQPQTGQWVPQSMAPDEELNTQKLDDMKYALGDLKIVDVRRKPAGLSANLRNAGEVRKDRRSVESLAQRGFYVARVEGREELLSSEGEIRVVMKDGVAYILRFGQIAGTSSPAPKKDDSKSKDDQQKSAGVNRYLFVMAEFNPDVIEKPKLEPLPPEPKPEEAKPEAKKEEAKKESKDQGAKTDSEKKDSEKKDEKPDPKAERERIQKENQKKEEEYKEKLKKAEERVKELNARFADWYYVIADDVYQKIHLGRKDVVKKKEKKEEEKKDGEHKDEKPAAPANSPAELKELKDALPVPKPESPKMEASKPEAPKPEASKPEAPKPEASKPEAAKPEAPTPETPKPETPKPEAAKPEAAKPEASKTESPTPEASKPESPKPETPKPEAPSAASEGVPAKK